MNTTQSHSLSTRLKVALGALAAAGGTAALVVAGVPALASAHSPAARTVTGPEVIAGTVHGKAALANVTKIPLKWQGLVSTHSVVILGGGGGPHKGNVKTLPSPAGKLTVKVSSNPTSTQTFSKKTCRITFTEDIPVTVLGAKSTRAFAGSSGPGAAQIFFAAIAPRFKTGPHKGQCNPNGQPGPKGAEASFLASLVLTVK